MFVNPITPNLADYSTFLSSGVGIPSENLPPDFSGEGAVFSGSNVLTISQVNIGALYIGASLYDTSLFISSGTTLAAFISGSGGLGDYEMSSNATGDVGAEIVSAYNSQIVTTFDVAMDIVNSALNCASSNIYVLAVYNLAADRLFNYAIDVPEQTYFKDIRKNYRLLDFTAGVSSSVSDQGTAVGILNPEQMSLFTLQDLQTLKTPYGRQYMAFAQMYGRTLWGLT